YYYYQGVTENFTDHTVLELAADICRPLPIVRWAKLNGDLPLSRMTDLSNAESAFGKMLIIKKARREDAGIYECHSGEIVHQMRVIIQAPPSWVGEQSKKVFVPEEGTINLKCSATGDPVPEFYWLRNGKVIHYDRIRVMGGGETLQIQNASYHDDSGMYQCNASNSNGYIFQNIFLKVLAHAPYFEMDSDVTMDVIKNSTVYLPCEFKAAPKAVAVWVDKDNRHYTLQIFKNNTLKIVGTKPSDEGLYYCNVSNKYGIDRATYKLLVYSNDFSCINLIVISFSGIGNIRNISYKIADVPATPRIQMLQCSDEQAFISWNRPEDYVLRRHWILAVYKFRVIACNKHGQSEPGYTNSKCVTQRTRPTTNPSNVSAEGNEPNNLVIRWNPMEKIDWNGPELEYLVKYRQDTRDSQWRHILIQDAGSTTVRDLPTYTRYLVQVKARNVVGDSTAEPEVITGFSGENFPIESPKNFVVVEQANWTCTTVSWTPVNPNTVRGHFKGYLIEYWLDEFSNGKQKVYVDKFTDVTQLQDLQPVSNYTAQIVTINKRYRSPEPSVLHFATAEGLPSEVHNLRIRAVGANTLFASWEKCRHPNGVILGYFIQFNDNENEISEETFVLNRQLYYLYEKARPNTNYTISVWGKTYAGEGAKVSDTVKTWPIKEPDVPTFEVHVLTPYQAEVIWHPFKGSKWIMPGSSFYVNYSKQGENTWIKSQAAKLPEKVVVLRNLSEGTEYMLIGVAEERNRLSSSRSIIIRTPSDGFLTRILQGHMHGTAWFISTMCVLLIATFTVMIMCCCQRQHSGKYPVKRKELEKGCFQPDSDEHKNFMEYQYGFSS
uniref:Neuroglian n=1 Tax=Syphacia muris TaxID=451379 RepID=A0A0N5ALF2_9BILA